MKVTYSQIKEKEIELTFPAFVQFSAIFYKIIDEKTLLIVEEFGFNLGITVKTISVMAPFGNEGWKFITEQEFNDALNRVSYKLSQYFPKLETA